MTSEFMYKHQRHSGLIYAQLGVWRIADRENPAYTAYQVPGVDSSLVPEMGWQAGLDNRTLDGMGNEPAPIAKQVFGPLECVFSRHNDGHADGVIVTGAGTPWWNGCYSRVDKIEGAAITSEFMYKHQEHDGLIYAQNGVWRIADRVDPPYTAYQAPDVRCSTVPRHSWRFGLDHRTPAEMGAGPAPTVQEVFSPHQCVFARNNDGLADGLIVTGAGTAKWNGCYDRVDRLPNSAMTSEFMYRHQEHSGLIYAQHGTWRIADRVDPAYTAYQVPNIESSTAPQRGWTFGLDPRTPDGMGDAPAPFTQEVIQCALTAHDDGLADGVVVTGAGTPWWNGCYDRVERLENAAITSQYMYKHQKHRGLIYAQHGVWRIADRVDPDFTAYQVPDVNSSTVPFLGWRFGLDDRTPAGMGVGPAPTAQEVFAPPQCMFTRHSDGHADGVIVTGAGTPFWNGCYDRIDKLEGAGITSDFMWKHQKHRGLIYAQHGAWRIADRVDPAHTAYQAPNVESSTVPQTGWTFGLDSRTPQGAGDAPAPTAQEVFNP